MKKTEETEEFSKCPKLFRSNDRILGDVPRCVSYACYACLLLSFSHVGCFLCLGSLRSSVSQSDCEAALHDPHRRRCVAVLFAFASHLRANGAVFGLRAFQRVASRCTFFVAILGLDWTEKRHCQIEFLGKNNRRGNIICNIFTSCIRSLMFVSFSNRLRSRSFPRGFRAP